MEHQTDRNSELGGHANGLFVDELSTIKTLEEPGHFAITVSDD